MAVYISGGLQIILDISGRFRHRVADGVAEPQDIPEQTSPTNCSRVPLARLKSLTIGLLCRVALEGAVAEPQDIPEQTSPTKSSSVPLARLKSLTIGLLYRVALEACQRHAATFRAENHTKLEFCNTPGHIQGGKSYKTGVLQHPLPHSGVEKSYTGISRHPTVYISGGLPDGRPPRLFQQKRLFVYFVDLDEGEAVHQSHGVVVAIPAGEHTVLEGTHTEHAVGVTEGDGVVAYIPLTADGSYVDRT